MKQKRIYENLEKILKTAKITRKELVTLFDFDQNTMTRKLAGNSKLSLQEATVIRDYIHKKTGMLFELEYLFKI